MNGLTPRQSECLAFIRRFLVEHGFCPSYKEIGAAIGLRSVGGVARLLGGLSRRGAIRIHPRRKRGIEVLAEDSDVHLAAILDTVSRRGSAWHDDDAVLAAQQFLKRRAG